MLIFIIITLNSSMIIILFFIDWEWDTTRQYQRKFDFEAISYAMYVIYFVKSVVG